MQFKISSNMPLERKKKLEKILQKELVFECLNSTYGSMVKLAIVNDEHQLILFIKNDEIYDYNITFCPCLVDTNDDLKMLWMEQKAASLIHKVNVKDDAYTLVFLTVDNKLFMQSFVKHKVWKQGKIKQYSWEENSYPRGLKDLIEFLKKKEK